MFDKQRKQLFTMMLIFTMPLSLCSCMQKENEDYTVVVESTVVPTPLATSDLTKENESYDVTQENETSNLDNSLEKLRNEYKDSNVSYVTTYLGEVGGLFENSFEEDFPKWLKENNELLLKEYPFIMNIDWDHIIGIMGYLYCVVPIDEHATVAVNRVRWNKETQSEESTEVLYREESGEPILLFVNYDDEELHVDREIFITDNKGNSCKTYLLVNWFSDQMASIPQNEQCTWIDFSNFYYDDAVSLEDWMNEGWLGSTALGLAGDQSSGMGWFNDAAVKDDKIISCSLRFYHDEENGGSVDVQWSDETGNSEKWSGFWTLETENDQPSRLTLSLSLVGGTNYDTTDGPVYMSETYPILISPSGTKLLIGKGENGILLPFASSNMTFCMMTGAYG